jgi:hypothetical protein
LATAAELLTAAEVPRATLATLAGLPLRPTAAEARAVPVHLAAAPTPTLLANRELGFPPFRHVALGPGERRTYQAPMNRPVVVRRRRLFRGRHLGDHNHFRVNSHDHGRFLDWGGAGNNRGL